MPNSPKGHGTGLHALLSRPALRPAPSSLALAAIQPGRSQPRARVNDDTLEELAASIRANGVIQPILVRPRIDPPATFEIIAGERRWRAAQLAGLTQIPAIVREASDEEAVVLALIENIQREELTPADEARTLKRLLDEFRLTHDAIATAVGRSRASVTNLVRLLELPPELIAMLEDRTLSMGHARALLGLDKHTTQLELARLVVARKLSVRETENRVRTLQHATPRRPTRPELSVVTEVLRGPGLHAQLQQKRDGKARIVVEVASDDQRDRLLEAIREIARSSR